MRENKYKIFSMLVVLLLSVNTALAQDSLWKAYIDAGTMAYENAKTTSKDAQARRYADAERRFNLARKEAENFGPQDPRLALTLSNLALVYLKQDKVAEAKSAATQALKIWDNANWGKRWGTQPLQAASSLVSLASALLAKNEFDQIEVLLTHALKIQTAILKPEHPAIGRTLYYLAITNYLQGKSADSKPRIKEAIRIYENARETLDHKEILDMLRDGSIIDQEDAETLLKNALEFRDQNREPEYFDIEILSVLAGVYTGQKNYQAAQATLTRMLETTKRTYGSKHVRMANGLKDLGNAYSRAENYGKAAAAYREGLETLAHATGDTRRLRFDLLDALQTMYRLLGKGAEAEPVVEEALKVVEELAGRQDPSFASYLNTQGVLLMELEKFERAELVFKTALSLQEGKLKADDPDLINTQNGLAKAYYEQGKYELAEPLYVKVIETARKVKGLSPVTLARYIKNYALLLYALGRNAEAEPLFQESLNMFATHHEEDRVSNMWEELAELYHRQKKYSLAEPLYQKAVTLMEKPGADRLSLVLALEKYALLLRETHRESEAVAAETRAKEIKAAVAGGP